MKCFHCDGEYQERTAMLKIGEKIILDDIFQYRCDTCNSKVYPPSSVKKIEEEVERIYPDYPKKVKTRKNG